MRQHEFSRAGIEVIGKDEIVGHRQDVSGNQTIELALRQRPWIQHEEVDVRAFLEAAPRKRSDDLHASAGRTHSRKRSDDLRLDMRPCSGRSAAKDLVELCVRDARAKHAEQSTVTALRLKAGSRGATRLPKQASRINLVRRPAR